MAKCESGSFFLIINGVGQHLFFDPINLIRFYGFYSSIKPVC